MANRFLYSPFRFGRQGGVAVTDDADRHLRDKILAVLFTAPGERVNNPSLGVGIGRVVFEPLEDLALAALEYTVSQGLQRDLGDEVLIDGVDLTGNPPAGELVLRIDYRRRSDREPRNLEIVL